MADPVTVDPNHYTVEFENDRVRVLRVHYNPGEKSTMHGHPDCVLVMLADGGARFHHSDGASQDADMKAGQVMWTPAVEHQPENVGSTPIKAILVELK